jgi:AraC-like DNA-binding protein
VDVLCRALGASRGTIYTVSKNAFGMGVSDYIRSRRISAAIALLKVGEMPIYKIAETVGITDANYLTKLIAVHEAKNNIRCNAVLPGMTATEAVEQNLTEEFRDLFRRHIPLDRMGLPEEIAAAVVYFASDESAYTTGQILTVSGGFGLATPIYGDLVNKTVRR